MNQWNYAERWLAYMIDFILGAIVGCLSTLLAVLMATKDSFDDEHDPY